jgi:hypothetical protein
MISVFMALMGLDTSAVVWFLRRRPTIVSSTDLEPVFKPEKTAKETIA